MSGRGNTGRWCQLRAQRFNGLSVVERRPPMTRVTCLVAGLMLFAASAAAQAPAAGQKLGLAASMQSAYTTLKGNLTQAAEKMPEANYTFKPASDPDLRTYGQWIGHQTDNQFTNCAIIKGVPNPSPPQSNEKKTRKAELVKALADAFAFCDGAFSALTDQSAMQMVKQGEGETARGGVASAMLSHGLESYGIVVVYLRAKGIAPPNANPAGARGGRGGRGGQ
ncbi:MAG: hypothetical protein DMG12_23975 [Acidobacteria bacterium]|nr:MAG: hypothetical protein DMG12_23975 [Acidobacteriota bacterium]